MDVWLTTLGNPGVRVGEAELSALPGKPVTFGLLVHLAMEREAPRDRLLGIFWPESPQDRARHTLSQTLYELRQDLGEAWADCAGTTVRTTEALHVDAREFERLVERGRQEEALGLYAGHFLDGVHLVRTHAFQEWVERQRARLSRRHRAVADTFIRTNREEGRLEVALKAAWKWAGLDPLDDGAQHHLIQLLAETGSRTEALTHFRRYEALLEAELGLEPLDETREMVEAIRRGDGIAPPSGQPAPGEAQAEEPPAGERAPGKAPPGEAAGAAKDPEGDGASGGDEPDRKEGPAGPWPPPLPAEAHTSTPTEEEAREGGLRDRLESELAPSLRVLRPVGRGSMAQVFLAREPHLKRLVAVKVLSPHLYDSTEARRRFQREAQAAARLNHPHVCTVYRVGSLSDGTPYLVSPFVKGTSLAQRLEAEGRLIPSEVRRVIREVASGLHAAHKLGIIHRDVRPDNVLREEETGRHFLCDFGIAGVLESGEEGPGPKITKTGEILGHPAYISPEQVEGGEATDRVDVYSLGVMAHQLLTGRPPPPTRRPSRGRKKEIVAPPDLEPLREFLGESHGDLVDLIGRCLATNPSHRPSTGDIVRKCREGAPEAGASGSTGEKPPSTPFRALLERRLPQMIGGYVAAGWLTLEFTAYLVAETPLPELAERLVQVTLPFGLLAVTVTGWFHGKKGQQQVSAWEKLLLGLIGVGWLVGCALVVF